VHIDDFARYVRRAALTWEALRVVYNFVLLVEYVTSPLPLRGIFWFYGLVPFLVIANAFYCFGPLIESYAYVVFDRHMGRGRHWLFGAGLLLSTGVIVFLSRLIP
jgi:hypothetical protein